MFLQAMRTLSWKPHLGSVTLDVELEDRTLTNLTVSPIHAAIILHFQEKSNLLFVFQNLILWLSQVKMLRSILGNPHLSASVPC